MHRSAQRRQIALALHDNAQFPQDAGKSREDEVQSVSQAQNTPQGNQEISFPIFRKILDAFFNASFFVSEIFFFSFPFSFLPESALPRASKKNAAR